MRKYSFKSIDQSKGSVTWPNLELGNIRGLVWNALTQGGVGDEDH